MTYGNHKDAVEVENELIARFIQAYERRIEVMNNAFEFHKNYLSNPNILLDERFEQIHQIVEKQNCKFERVMKGIISDSKKHNLELHNFVMNPQKTLLLEICL